MNNDSTVTTLSPPGGPTSPVNPIDQHANVQYRIQSLVGAADAERVAALQRRAHVMEHAVHPSLAHAHAPHRVRRALGHALITLGAAVAGTAADRGARRAA